ncbi:DUF3298 and DUF4163 domain-containing protein [Hymenobacter rubripertinctus]|uniref:DUF3298 domain-containing protein n=1 Tax=Hymenobacter rubripertinctus TaxID=2029981 RepID=A0A418R483_9BACT|nr:DUF3298 and DUF4163 domain-containing protein [Hymenobacter rubripertinctus]RIY12155.1 DUF3298 domain-containing protein [Hymenobacter rubripertinctus]
MSSIFCFRPALLLRQLSAPLALGLLLTACNSGSDTSDATTATATTKPAGPQNDDGSWYRQYRGLLPGSADSITLHLQRLGSPSGEAALSRLVGFYAASDGHPYEIAGDLGLRGDSLNLHNISNELAGDEDEEPAEIAPQWLLKEQGDALVGIRNGQPVRLRRLEPVRGIQFEAHRLSAEVAARPGHPEDSVSGRRTMQLLLPFQAPNQELLAANIRRGLHGDSLDSMPVPVLDSIWQEQLRAFTRDYRTDAAPLLAANAKKSPADYQPLENLAYEQEVNTYVLWNEGNLLSMGYFGYDYSGGAHGIYGTYVQSYDTRTGHSLRYDDIFKSGIKPQLQKLLGQYARPVVGLKASEPLSKALAVNTLPVTRNVYLTSGGAVFVYLPYEIASYAKGQISVFVPFSALQGLLKPGLPVGNTAAVASR